MDDDLLQRGLRGLHEPDALLVRKPVHVGAVVVSEVDLHVLDDHVPEVLQVPVEDVEVPVAGGDRLPLPVLQQEPDVVLADVPRVQLQVVVPEDPVDVDQDGLVLRAGRLLGVLVCGADVLVYARSGVWGLFAMVSLEPGLVEASGLQSREEALEPQELVNLLTAERCQREVAEHRGQAADVDHAGVVLVRHPHPRWSGRVGASDFGVIANYIHDCQNCQTTV